MTDEDVKALKKWLEGKQGQIVVTDPLISSDLSTFEFRLAHYGPNFPTSIENPDYFLIKSPREWPE